MSNKYFLCNGFRMAAIAATVALVAGCASMGAQTPEKVVEKRATDYWKARMSAEMALMEELIPLLKKRAEGQEISGLKAYED